MIIQVVSGFLHLDSELQTLKSDVWIFIIFLTDETKSECTAKFKSRTVWDLFEGGQQVKHNRATEHYGQL